jgi:hypothetical protein
MAKSNLLVFAGGKGTWGFTWAAFSGDPSEITNAIPELLCFETTSFGPSNRMTEE